MSLTKSNSPKFRKVEAENIKRCGLPFKNYTGVYKPSWNATRAYLRSCGYIVLNNKKFCYVSWENAKSSEWYTVGVKKLSDNSELFKKIRWNFVTQKFEIATPSIEESKKLRLALLKVHQIIKTGFEYKREQQKNNLRHHPQISRRRKANLSDYEMRQLKTIAKKDE